MASRKVVAGVFLLLSTLLILLGALRGELKVIGNNGKILCLTCIGIK